MNYQIRADYSPTSEYYIDFARGSIYHSQTSSRGQKHRIFDDQPVAGRMKHFNYPQATDLFKKTKTAEMYFQLLRQVAVAELGRGANQASSSYIRNHQRVFDYPLNTLSYPIAQNISVGFVRSPVDRQKLYDWMSVQVDKSLKYGQVAYMPDDSTKRTESIADELRKVAFAA